MTTRVVNIRSLPLDPREWPPDHIYIGRAMPRRRLVGSPWRNPFVAGTDGTRDEVVALFQQYIADRHALRASVRGLKDKVLVCWCAPEACHGDMLARLADEATS